MPETLSTVPEQAMCKMCVFVGCKSTCTCAVSPRRIPSRNTVGPCFECTEVGYRRSRVPTGKTDSPQGVIIQATNWWKATLSKKAEHHSATDTKEKKNMLHALNLKRLFAATAGSPSHDVHEEYVIPVLSEPSSCCFSPQICKTCLESVAHTSRSCPRTSLPFWIACSLSSIVRQVLLSCFCDPPDSANQPPSVQLFSNAFRHSTQKIMHVLP